MKEVEIKEFERVDDLHRKGYLIIQDPKRFCFGVDAVLLAGFAHVKKGEKSLDLGTGTGIIPILLEARTQGVHFYGLEIQEESTEMARRSVALNKLEEKVTIETGDIKSVEKLYPCGSFDVVTSNPPYMNQGSGAKNDFGPKAIARHEILCTLEDVIKGASKMLRYGGRFYMVHRPNRLTDIMSLLRQNGLEPKVLRFVHPYVDKEPTMILVEANRGGNPFLRVLPPLVIYEEKGKYTKEIIQIYYE